jgi:anti-sigma regulatory factor (Ser/Thr protein kinase)
LIKVVSHNRFTRWGTVMSVRAPLRGRTVAAHPRPVPGTAQNGSPEALMSVASPVTARMAELLRSGPEQSRTRGEHPSGDPEVQIRALDCSRESAREAREFTRRTLDSWGVPELLDDLALVVSELVTNAVCHGVGVQRPAGGADPGTIRIALLRRGFRVVCAVQDPGGALPGIITMPSGMLDGSDPEGDVHHSSSDRTDVSGAELGDDLPEFLFDDAAESGRGLHIVGCFSTAWGWFPLPAAGPQPRDGHPVGKVVWAQFEIAS